MKLTPVSDFADLPATGKPLKKLTPFELGRAHGVLMRTRRRYTGAEIDRVCAREARLAKDAYTKGLIAGLRGE